MNNNKEISPTKSAITERCGVASIVTPFNNSKVGNFVMKTKRCFICKNTKMVECFNKDKSRSDGLCGRCRDCGRIEINKYRKTVFGVISTIYNGQIYRRKRDGLSCVEYTRAQFKDWCMENNSFIDLYNKWVISGYEKGTKPSVDRINDYKGYSFDNITMTTWEKNNRRGCECRKSGENNKMNRAVIQLDLLGNIINRHYSINEASRVTGCHVGAIIATCQGKYKTSGGFEWKYKSDYIDF